MAKKQRCYIYTRVSTELQIDGYSLEAQKERLRSEAKHRKMQVCGEYSDEGKSGKNIAGRPEFKKMLSDIKSGKDDVDYVLVFKLSRFGRNAADTLNSLQFMEDYGVNLLCVEDGIDSAGAAGKLIISVLASVAEIERSNISEQTMAGRQQKARDGLWNGGFAPYGYKLVAVEGQKSKMLVINEDEAKLIKLIYEKYLSGMGVNAVAKWLNDNGYRKTVRQNGTVPLISDHFVKGVLDNPVYAGKIAYGRRRNEKVAGTRNEFHVVKQDKDSYKLYPGKHEPIIDEETWYKVQVKRMKGIKTDYVCGTYWGKPDGNGQSHAWLMVDKYIIIDITGDQFSGKSTFLNYDKSVYVGEGDDFHRLFEVEDRDVHEHRGLSALGGFCGPRLWDLYRKILKYI